MKSVQIKVGYGQPHKMAAAFGVRALGTALVVIFGCTDFRDKIPEWASFPSLPQYRSGLPKRSRAPALQRLRRSDLCTRFKELKRRSTTCVSSAPARPEALWSKN